LKVETLSLATPLDQANPPIFEVVSDGKHFNATPIYLI